MAVSKENARIVVTVSQELKERLELEAARENRSLSNYVAIILQSKEMVDNGKAR